MTRVCLLMLLFCLGFFARTRSCQQQGWIGVVCCSVMTPAPRCAFVAPVWRFICWTSWNLPQMDVSGLCVTSVMVRVERIGLLIYSLCRSAGAPTVVLLGCIPQSSLHIYWRFTCIQVVTAVCTVYNDLLDMECSNWMNEQLWSGTSECEWHSDCKNGCSFNWTDPSCV